MGPCSKQRGYPVDAVGTSTMPRVSSGHPAAHLARCKPSCTPELCRGRLCAGSPTKSTRRAMQEQARRPSPPLGWTQGSTQLEAGPSSPLPDPPCICSPFPSPAASCTCTRRPSGIYPAPGARSTGSALINLSGTGARPSCLAGAHGRAPAPRGSFSVSAEVVVQASTHRVGPGVCHGEDGAVGSGPPAPLPTPSTSGNPRYVGGGMKSFWSSSKPLQLSGASADCGTCLVTDEASNPCL